jgi:hypothetical protein
MVEMRKTDIKILLKTKSTQRVACIGVLSGARPKRAGAWLMATSDYYRKQIELLLVWATAVTDSNLRIRLTQRALNLLTLANCTDDQTLRRFEELLKSIRSQNACSP